MNRSIAKTRNQLQRITFKINQLKTKYTGDNYAGNINGAENSPLSHSQYRQKQFSDNRPRQPMVTTYQNKHPQSSSSKQSTGNIVQYSNNGDQMYHKQFKVFRNQMYNYIDKCLLLSKERQQELIEKTIQSQMENSRTQARNKNNIQQRIKKIQQQTTNCITSVQDIVSQIKKNEKHFSDKLTNVENKIKKQIKDSNIAKNGQNLNSSQQLAKKIASLQKQSTLIKEQLTRNSDRTDKFQQLISQFSNKIDNVQKRVTKKMNQITTSQEDTLTSRYQALQQKIDNYNKFNVILQKQMLQFKVKNEKREDKTDQTKSQQNIMKKLTEMLNNQLQQQYASLSETLQKNCTDIGSVAESVLCLQHRIQQILTTQKKLQSIQSRRKNSQKIMQVQSQKLKSQVIQALQEALTTQIKNNIQSSYLKPRLQQVKRQFTTKINQQIQLSKQDTMITVEENIFENVNKIISQQNKRKSPKVEIDQSRIVSIDQIKQLQTNLKALIYEQLQQQKQRQLANIVKIQTMQSQQYEPRQKTSPNQPAQIKQSRSSTQLELDQRKVHQIVQEKLNQFENDINQTIKLLYEDIQNKVNEMMTHSGMMEFRNQIENMKRDVKEIETKMKSITILLTSNQQQMVHQHQNFTQNSQENQVSNKQLNLLQEKIKSFENLRSQIYSDMGQQIDKLSSILERTYEQMQMKVQKLDRNFSYIYERMSKIEYDNANFKDKLTSLLEGNRPSPFRPAKKQQFTYEIQTMKSSSSGSNILDVLGQLNSGRQFFGQGC